jgi:hypothetical protein
MKNVNGNRWMVWAIVILAVMNFTTFVTIVLERIQTGKEKVISNIASIKVEDNSAKYTGRFFRDQLILSREQMNRFIEFNPVFRQQARNINLDLDRIRRQMLIEMAANDSDTSKLNILSDSIGFFHASLKKVTYKYYLDIKNICNKEQQSKLKIIFDEIFTSDALPGQNGKGGPHGKGRGGR